MDKIELTDLQKQLIQKQLNEKYDPFMATEEEQEAFNDVIDKAEALSDELDAVDDYIDNYNGDMIAWFLAKYQEQEQKEQ
ncbi:hypothetical protein [uncultured Bacteroides sp.]|jgi:hypothetical protein|uniref:hypothetical protein n=1 Tax=uncultured Bacteroides sp. TaxID=162156 RepID=UPI002591FDAD|nr:hypothetical protein [uncultured Bacteroides sp.]